MNCLWIILLLFGCGNNCGCGNSRGLNNSCGCNNGCTDDRGRDKDCGCMNDGVRRGRRDSDYDNDSSVKSSRFPNISRSETCGCEKSEQSETVEQ